tara:strand:+ start:33400 stop:34353 length:954 start_codon:yes stop_codon:yes gene_type:complete
MSNSKIYNIAIIGAGKMALEYVKVIKNFQNLKIIGIVSRGDRNKKKLKIKYSDIEFYKNISDLYKYCHIDATIVAVSQDSTFKVAKMLVKFRSIKLFEKPFGLNYLEFKKLKKIYSNHNKSTFIAFNRREYSSVKYLQNLLRGNNGRRIITISDQENINFLKSSGKAKKIYSNWMYCNSIHLIDLINIFARGKLIKMTKSIPWKSTSRNFVSAAFHFSSSDIVIYNALWNRPGPWAINVSTKNEFFELKPLESLSMKKITSRTFKKFSISKKDQDYKPGLYLLVNELYKLLRGRSSKLVNIEEYEKSVKYLKYIYDV